MSVSALHALDAPRTVSEDELDVFCALVREQGALHWRELPWRGIDDAYAVLVSEVMLQQTQVKRVLRYWERFMGMFPTLDALAAADTASVLEAWQGLGYNRRALALKRCAEECSARYAGVLPAAYDELLALPGIGPATAGGVTAFARNERCVYLETNVRSVFLHHFFPDAQQVPDRLIVPLVERTCPEEDVRGWYYALLDYGAYLKKSVANPSRRSRHHVRQSEFEGSRRQKRAELVRLVLGAGASGIDRNELHAALNAVELGEGRTDVDASLFEDLLADLAEEGFFSFDGRRYRV